VLVSGVDRRVSREQLRTASNNRAPALRLLRGPGLLTPSTLSANARETAEWAKAMRYKSLTIVTTDYHMPRAMLELRAGAAAGRRHSAALRRADADLEGAPLVALAARLRA